MHLADQRLFAAKVLLETFTNLSLSQSTTTETADQSAGELSGIIRWRSIFVAELAALVLFDRNMENGIFANVRQAHSRDIAVESTSRPKIQPSQDSFCVRLPLVTGGNQ